MSQNLWRAVYIYCMFVLQALMKEHGDRQWNMLSEKERQRKLIQLKMKERRLRKEGKMDEIAELIGKHLENEKSRNNNFFISTLSMQKISTAKFLKI